MVGFYLKHKEQLGRFLSHRRLFFLHQVHARAAVWVATEYLSIALFRGEGRGVQAVVRLARIPNLGRLEEGGGCGGDMRMDFSSGASG